MVLCRIMGCRKNCHQRSRLAAAGWKTNDEDNNKN